MVGFRSRKDGTHYPLKKGKKQVYPTRKQIETEMKKAPFSENLGWTDPATGKITKAGKEIVNGIDEGLETRKKWNEKFHEEYGLYPASDKELNDYIKWKTKEGNHGV